MHKNTAFQPQPPKPEIREFQPVGKHCRGRLPKKGIKPVCGQQVAGASAGKPGKSRPLQLFPRAGKGGTPKGRERRAEFLSQSSEDAKRIAKDHSLRQAWTKFRAGLSAEERAFARKNRVLFPMAEGGMPTARGGQPEIDFHDPADLPEARENRTAVDALEPQSPFSVAIENLGSDEITAAAECFGSALTWALDVPDQRDLVVIGHRALGLIYLLRADLLTRPEQAQAQKIVGHTSGILPPVPWGNGLIECLRTGDIFGRVLEWVRRGTTLSEIAERLCLVAYVVRPTMMGSPTLHQLGEVMNKTRQAKDKLAGCLRDTFAGIRAMAQRGEHTRDRCIAAH